MVAAAAAAPFFPLLTRALALRGVLGSASPSLSSGAGEALRSTEASMAGTEDGRKGDQYLNMEVRCSSNSSG